MEQIANVNDIEFSREVLMNFYDELREVQSSNSRVHVKIIDKYLSKLIDCRSSIRKLYEEKFCSIRFKGQYYLQHMLNCLNDVLEILLFMPVHQTDKDFVAIYFHPLKLHLESYGILIKVHPSKPLN